MPVSMRCSGRAWRFAPSGICLVLISRTGPPPALSRPLANRAMTLLEREELRFNRSEAEELLRKSYAQAVPEQLIPQVYERTEGWAAGLVLLALSIARETALPRSAGELHYEKIFDYFASEIFEKISRETQVFLLKTAFLPQMTARMAQELSEKAQAARILSELSARCYFTTAHVRAGGDPAYQYHPLFRQFLRSRAEAAFRASSLKEIRAKAAALLEKAGQIEDAAQLLKETVDEEGLVRIILANAEALIRQGRHQTLRSWISGLSRQITEKHPWLLYWSSLAHLPVDPGTSQKLAEKAFALHRARRDYRGMFADCYPAVTAICLEQADFKLLDRWIAVLDRGFRALKTPLSPEIEAQLANTMFLALVLRQPQHPDIAGYRERLERACRSLQDADMRILLEADALLYHIWMGDFPKAAETMDSLLDLARLKKAAIQPLDPRQPPDFPGHVPRVRRPAGGLPPGGEGGSGSHAPQRDRHHGRPDPDLCDLRDDLCRPAARSFANAGRNKQYPACLPQDDHRALPLFEGLARPARRGPSGLVASYPRGVCRCVGLGPGHRGDPRRLQLGRGAAQTGREQQGQAPSREIPPGLPNAQ